MITRLFVVLAFAAMLPLAGGAVARPAPRPPELANVTSFHPASDMIYGGLVGAGKATRDTTYLLGGPGRLDGKFQDAAAIRTGTAGRMST